MGRGDHASELRAIADVVDKFEIPMVKVTGGQRIDMLGVSKEDLPAVWADLGEAGFVSGHAYAKGLRTVKTCVGSDWCRFGTQDSTGLGISIEKFMWGSWTPAKVKMAVSGCPRNCAEATCKDVGVICVDSGYEIHFAGAAGLDIKGTEVLGQVETEDEALEVIVALTQMYREQARYLERIYKWAKRVGIDQIKRQIIDDRAKRKAYTTASSIAEIRPDRPVGGPRAPGKDSTSSGRWPSWRGRRRNEPMNWIEIGALKDIPRRGARVVRTAARQYRRFPHRMTTRSLRSKTAARTRAGRCAGHRAWPAVTCPLHNFVIELESGRAVAPDEGCTHSHPAKVENGIVWLSVRQPAAVG